MKKLLLLLALVSSSAPAFETTDQGCLTNCINAGRLMSYCKSRCTVDTRRRVNRVDLSCVNDCTDAGGMLNFCRQKCAY